MSTVTCPSKARIVYRMLTSALLFVTICKNLFLLKSNICSERYINIMSESIWVRCFENTMFLWLIAIYQSKRSFWKYCIKMQVLWTRPHPSRLTPIGSRLKPTQNSVSDKTVLEGKDFKLIFLKLRFRQSQWKVWK